MSVDKTLNAEVAQNLNFIDDQDFISAIRHGDKTEINFTIGKEGEIWELWDAILNSPPELNYEPSAGFKKFMKVNFGRDYYKRTPSHWLKIDQRLQDFFKNEALKIIQKEWGWFIDGHSGKNLEAYLYNDPEHPLLSSKTIIAFGFKFVNTYGKKEYLDPVFIINKKNENMAIGYFVSSNRNATEKDAIIIKYDSQKI